MADLRRMIIERATGKKQNPLRAFAGATAAGVMTGALVYKFLRQ